MFTGIVAELGEVAHVGHHGDAASLTIRGSTEGVVPGESIAVNGVCLTVTGILDGTFTADVMGETLNRSGLGALGPGAPVNLERPVRLADRLGGHLVQGHVDGVGRIAGIRREEEWVTYRIAAGRDLLRHVVHKGSVAVDGVSLTVAGLASRVFTVALIPYTLQVTSLQDLRPGDPVNLEADVIAKYVERLLEGNGG